MLHTALNTALGASVSRAAHATVTLGYGAMRLRWCGAALQAFVARWAVHGLVTGLVLSAGASGWVQVLQGIAAALVLPLLAASRHGWLLLPATLVQGLAGAAAVWGARSLLWPAHWADSERALPLPRGATRCSDLFVVLLVLTPLLVLYLVGMAAVLAHRPQWLQPTRGRALAALAFAACVSLGLGTALLQWQRRHRAGSPAVQGGEHGVVAATTRSGRLSAWRAVILLPLWRGPARRTGVTIVAGSAALVLAGALPAVLRGPAGWWPWMLAAWAAIALVATTRINHLARLELNDLLHACAVLPVRLRRLHAMRSALGLLPLLPGLAGMLIGVVTAPPDGLHTAVLSAWAIACVLACLTEVAAGGQAAAHKSARWWFSLVVCASLASEVVA